MYFYLAQTERHSLFLALVDHWYVCVVLGVLLQDSKLLKLNLYIFLTRTNLPNDVIIPYQVW